jgi:hypothetical protein
LGVFRRGPSQRNQNCCFVVFWFITNECLLQGRSICRSVGSAFGFDDLPPPPPPPQRTHINRQASGRIQSLRAFRRTTPGLLVVGGCLDFKAVGLFSELLHCPGHQVTSEAHRRGIGDGLRCDSDLVRDCMEIGWKCYPALESGIVGVDFSKNV